MPLRCMVVTNSSSIPPKGSNHRSIGPYRTPTVDGDLCALGSSDSMDSTPRLVLLFSLNIVKDSITQNQTHFH